MNMKVAELKQKSKSELQKMLVDCREKSRVLRFDLVAGKVKNVREIRNIKKDIARILTISNEMQRTVVVRVERLKEHQKYKRRYLVFKKYKAHYDGGEYQAGDKVVIEECRPLSKEKRWRVITKISSSNDQTSMPNK